MGFVTVLLGCRTMSGLSGGHGDGDMEPPAVVLSPLDAVVASMIGGDVERVSDAIVAAGGDGWFSATWAWARLVVELAGTGSATRGAVPLGIWVGRHLPVTCEAELVETVSVVIATAVDGLPSTLRKRWAALGEAGQIRCGEVMLALAAAAGRDAVARNGPGARPWPGEDGVWHGSR